METLSKVAYVAVLLVGAAGCGGGDDGRGTDAAGTSVVALDARPDLPATAGDSGQDAVDDVAAPSATLDAGNADAAPDANREESGADVADAGDLDGPVLGALNFGSLAADRSSVDFGSVVVDVTSSIQVVTFRNSGSADTGGPMLNLSGVAADSFIFTSTCSAPLAPTESCAAAVAFHPNAPGSARAVLTAFDSHVAVSVVLTGTGTAARPEY
jgi:hypothetical protein